MELYREFTCIICGRKAIDRGCRQDARYCGDKCRKIGCTFFKNTENACKYNSGVCCNEEKCDSCGWNPAVAAKRLECLV